MMNDIFSLLYFILLHIRQIAYLHAAYNEAVLFF